MDKVQKVEVDHEQIDSYLPAIYKKLESLSREGTDQALCVGRV